jgi:hypothetical protein
MKKSISLLILMLLIFSSGFSQTRIKTLFYNLLYSSGAPNDRELTLKSILDTYNPDIFTVCELETVDGADEILSQSIQASRPNFARATFVNNQSDNSADNQLNQMIFYNTDMFTLESQQTHLTYIRDIMQYTLLLKTVDQATRKVQQNGNGAYSGIDDRFDFTFVSKNLTTGSDLNIVPGTYDAYGNNKKCYDKDINNTSCTGEYSEFLRDDLYIMSDHTPVVMELETTKTILSVEKEKLQSEFRMLGSNLINSNVSIQISSDLYNSKLLIYNRLGQFVKTIDTTTDSQILNDVSNLSNGMCFITSSIKNRLIPLNS